MPYGAKYGGRKAGTPNKRTVEKRVRAQQELDDARFHGKKLAIDRMRELLEIAVGVMAAHQPVSADQVAEALARDPQTKLRQQTGNLPIFGEWWDRAAFACKNIMRHETPELKAIAVAPAPAPALLEGPRAPRKLRIFEGGKVIELKPIGERPGGQVA